MGNVEIGGVYSFDVTKAITTNGVYSFAITSINSDGCGYNSREHPGTPPELVITSVPVSGSGGAGGQVASGGASAGGAGQTGGTSNTTTSAGAGAYGSLTPSADGDGCSCRTAGGSPASGWALWLAALSLTVARRRKQRGSCTASTTAAP